MGLISAILALFGTIFLKLLADEAKAWLPHLIERLVRQAVRCLPEDERERLAEEWRADLNETPGDLTKLVIAIDFFRAASIIDTSSQRRISARLVAGVLVVGALWDLFTTFYGLAGYFDLPLNPVINLVQFGFALVLMAIVLGFVIATQLIWTIEPQDFVGQVLKAAWGVCISINLLTSWQGTKHYMFYRDDGNVAQWVGLALATALTVSSAIFLSRLVLGKPVAE